MIKRHTLSLLLTALAAPLASFAQDGFKPRFNGKDHHRLGWQTMRTAMLQWMEQTQDPLLAKFRATIGVKEKEHTEPSKPSSSPAEGTPL